MNMSEIMDGLKSYEGKKSKNPQKTKRGRYVKEVAYRNSGVYLKQMDRNKFAHAVDQYVMDRTPVAQIYKATGLSRPTFEKRLMQYLTDGYLPGEMFIDGYPMILNIVEASPMTKLAKEVERSKQYGIY